MTRLADALERASRPAKRPDALEAKDAPNGPELDTLEPRVAGARAAETDAPAPERQFAPAKAAESAAPAEPVGHGPMLSIVKPGATASDAKPAAAKPSKPAKPAGPIPLLRRPAELPANAPVHADPELAGKLIGTPGVPFGCVEQYRKLAATLHHVQVERGIKVLMISSAVASEGKTLTSTNIALTLSESYGKRVLIIDADLRRPTLHQIFNLPNLTGLSDALRSERDRTIPLTQVASRLSALTAGRPDADPMSGLTSPRMRRIVQEATTVFDWVIIDTPPAGLLPDAKLITQLAEAAILVIRAGRAPVQLVMQAVESLGRDRIVGVVLNGVDEKASAAAPYYGYGYYSYGGYDQPSSAKRE
jgi:capsular exopolysaccharide synthesis family protein